VIDHSNLPTPDLTICCVEDCIAQSVAPGGPCLRHLIGSRRAGDARSAVLDRVQRDMRRGGSSARRLDGSERTIEDDRGDA
jgi:hypothetical protein